MASICRLCATLKNIETFVCIHEKGLDLCNKLEKCCQLNIPNNNDVLPQNVCNECVKNLNQSWKFLQKVHESHESLSKVFYISDDSNETSNDKFYEKLTSPVIQNEPKIKTILNNKEIIKNSKIEITTEQQFEINDFICNLKNDTINVNKNLQEYQNYENNDENQFNENLNNQIDEQTIKYRIIDNDEQPYNEFINENLNNFNEFNETPNDINLNNDNDNNTKLIELSNGETWQEYPWKCIDCNDYTGKNAIELKSHVVALHGNGYSVKYLCVDCLKTFDRYNDFINHVKVRHRKSLNFSCDFCSKIFINIELLSKHRNNEHNDIIEKHKSYKDEDKFINNKLQKKKIKLIKDFQLIFCLICSKAFNSNNALLVHKKIHKPDKYQYECDICNKKFVTKPNLKAHAKIHAGVKEYVCDHCAKGFVQKVNLDEHVLTHFNDELFECKECNKKFKTPARLAKHKIIHSDIRPHACNECGSTFKEKDTLKTHMRIHTGAMPYKCEHCGKSFRFRSALKTHYFVHSGERPYSCKDCNHHFTNWPNYNKHMKRRHGIDKSQQRRNVPLNSTTSRINNKSGYEIVTSTSPIT